MPREAAVWVGGRGQRDVMAFGCQHQARDQIPRKERRVGGGGDDMAGPLRMRPVEPGQDARQRACKAFDAVAYHGVGIAKPGRIAIGVQRNRGNLRLEPVDDMGQHGFAAEHEQALVAAAHPAGLTASKNNTYGLLHLSDPRGGIYAKMKPLGGAFSGVFARFFFDFARIGVPDQPLLAREANETLATHPSSEVSLPVV